MKTLIISLFLTFSTFAMASSGDLFFTEGPKRGQNVLASSIGYYEMCYTGNPYAVRIKVLRHMNEDIEKDQSFVRIDTRNNSLLISYVDTKCMDDSLSATAASCRSSWIAPRCR